MARGDGTEAVRHAEQAVELAAGCPSARHRVKTQVVYAAALCSAGRIDEARAVADDALSATATLGLVPLQWALASLLVDIVGDHRFEAHVVSDRVQALGDEQGVRVDAERRQHFAADRQDAGFHLITR